MERRLVGGRIEGKWILFPFLGGEIRLAIDQRMDLKRDAEGDTWNAKIFNM